MRRVYGQLKTHLHDCSELYEFVVIEPAAQTIGKGHSSVCRIGIGDRLLAEGGLNEGVEIFGFGLDLVPFLCGMAYCASDTGSIEADCAEEVEEGLGGTVNEHVEVRDNVELGISEDLIVLPAAAEEAVGG